MIKNICIVGGGTSGMVAALMIKKSWPNIHLTVIESSQLGIIGVGEGSTEHWKKFIEKVDITVFELMRETGATFKIGIKFTDWHGDGTHYFHSLIEDLCKHAPETGLPYTWYKMIGEGWDPLRSTGAGRVNRHYEPLQDNINQFHFDTFKLNQFLHKKCKERGIEIIDAIIKDVILDEHGYITQLISEDGEKYTYDFYIDCTGFKRVLANKLGVRWISKKQYLPMNSAIAFPTGYQEDIPSWTEATALSSGWTWRIPTQDRFGNGYVYSDQFTTDDHAYREICDHYKNNLKLDDEIKIGRSFKFDAGHIDKFWSKNCVSMGLSAVFVEPLEASSIGTTIQQCFMLIPSLAFYDRGETLTEKKYNEMMTVVCDNIVDFIQLHYFTERQDSAFWKFCKNELTMTDFNREYLDYFKQHMTNVYYFNDHFTLFKHLNFMQVMHGLRMFEKDKIIEIYKDHLSNQFESEISRVICLNEDFTDIRNLKHMGHREAIEVLKTRNKVEKYSL